MDYAWVIEYGSAPFYWTGNGFSAAHGDAVRFAREVDARRALNALKTDEVRAACRVLEHGWAVEPTPQRRCEACNLPVDEGRFLCNLCTVGFDKTVWAVLCRGKHEELIEPLRVVARGQGYALAVHGSLARDIDVVAIPWTEEAVDAPALVAAIVAEVERVNGHAYMRDRDANPTEKPHGRRAWSIHLGGGPYIDLSVMPRAATTLKLVDLHALRPGDQVEAIAQHLHRQETVPWNPSGMDVAEGRRAALDAVVDQREAGKVAEGGHSPE